MDWNNIVCPRCQSIEYELTVKNMQQTCYCKKCGKFLGNKPKDNYDIANMIMPFGKFKGQKISEILDLRYLHWVLGNIKLSNGIKQAIEHRLEKS